MWHLPFIEFISLNDLKICVFWLFKASRKRREKYFNRKECNERWKKVHFLLMWFILDNVDYSQMYATVILVICTLWIALIQSRFVWVTEKTTRMNVFDKSIWWIIEKKNKRIVADFIRSANNIFECFPLRTANIHLITKEVKTIWIMETVNHCSWRIIRWHFYSDNYMIKQSRRAFPKKYECTQKKSLSKCNYAFHYVFVNSKIATHVWQFQKLIDMFSRELLLNSQIKIKKTLLLSVII